MSHPDYSRGYLRVPLDTWLAVYCQAALSRRQLQLLSFVIRETWGWRDKTGGIVARGHESHVQRVTLEHDPEKWEPARLR